jgi:hypothetical protein
MKSWPPLGPAAGPASACSASASSSGSSGSASRSSPLRTMLPALSLASSPSGAWLSTVVVSSMGASSSTASKTVGAPAATVTSLCASGEKRVRETSTRYEPGARPTMRYAPLGSVVAVFCVGPVTSIVAPGSAAPVLSVTWPVSPPVACAVAAGGAPSTNTAPSRTAATRARPAVLCIWLPRCPLIRERPGRCRALRRKVPVSLRRRRFPGAVIRAGARFPRAGPRPSAARRPRWSCSTPRPGRPA